MKELDQNEALIKSDVNRRVFSKVEDPVLIEHDEKLTE